MKKKYLRSKTPLKSKALKSRPFSGCIILRFAYEYAYFEGNNLLDFAQKYQLKGLYDLLTGEYKPKSIQRQVSSISMDKLKQLEDRAKEVKLPPFIVQRSGLKPLRSLSNYWRLDYKNTKQDLTKIAGLFGELQEVDLAYKELLAYDAEVYYRNDPHYAKQLYWDAAPKGIDAKWVWEIEKIEGQGVGLIDLEQGWKLPHQDLSAAHPSLIVHTNADGINGYQGAHGTNTLGVVAAADNAMGIVGIAPSLQYVKLASHYHSGEPGYVADAIGKVLEELHDGKIRKGDVLLLEVQRGDYPVEVDDSDFCAIQLACDLGIVVVEAAGNGGYDLDEWHDSSGCHRLNQAHRFHFEDSGAIIVGAARAEPPAYDEHDRKGSSNFGNRVDCYAWGENVATTGGDGRLSGRDSFTAADDFTTAFGGTSAASAIIAGAAILLQCYYKRKRRRTLSSYEVRFLLSNPSTGTPQGNGMTGHIGVMPDLRKILENPYVL
ncbi:MAG: S8 family serine peptidase [Chitinophagales bacterium]